MRFLIAIEINQATWDTPYSRNLRELCFVIVEIEQHFSGPDNNKVHSVHVHIVGAIDDTLK